MSPRRTGSSTAGGAPPQASAGRRRTASRWRGCRRRPLATCSSSRPTSPPRPRRVDRSGYLRGDHDEWLRDPQHLEGWARAALGTAHLQHDAAAATSVRLVGTVLSESAAAVLCLELRRDGLPIDRARTEQLLTDAVDPAPPRMPMSSPRVGPATRSCWPTCPDASRPTCATPPRCSTCSRRWGSTCPTRASGCSSPTARPTRWSTPCSTGGATSGSPRPTGTGGSTRTSGPTTGCAGGGRPATARPAG